MCSHCSKVANGDEEILAHVIDLHPKGNYCVGIYELDNKTGKFGYRTKKFNFETKLLKEMRNTGRPFTIDYDKLQLRAKRSLDPLSDILGSDKKKLKPENEEEYIMDWDDESTNTLISQAIHMVPSVIAALKEINRADDFICVLNNIANGKLTGNIALSLLLDIGQVLRQNTVHSVRYSEVSKNFWTLVQKMFHGKAIRFFSGMKGTGFGDELGKYKHLSINAETFECPIELIFVN